MKQLREGGMQEVLSLRNRVGRALGKQEITKASHDRLWDLLDSLEREIIHSHEEEGETCQHQESSQSRSSVSELG